MLDFGLSVRKTAQLEIDKKLLENCCQFVEPEPGACEICKIQKMQAAFDFQITTEQKNTKQVEDSTNQLTPQEQVFNIINNLEITWKLNGIGALFFITFLSIEIVVLPRMEML